MLRKLLPDLLAARRGDPVDASPTRSGPFVGLLRSALHLVALWAFAVAQPLFDLIGRNAVFLVAHRASRVEVVFLVLLLTLGMPAVLVAVEALVGWISVRARNAVHLVFVGLLLAAISLPLLNRLLAPSGILWSAYLVVATGVLAAAYARYRGFRQTLTALSVSVVLFAGYFLFATPVSGLIVPSASAEGVGSIGDAAPPVVMVVFDELPVASLMTTQGDIDANRFPNVARLSQHSTWYRNATVAHPTTRFSVPSLLTGARAVSSLPIASEYPRNLFAMLEDSHRLDVRESVTELCRQAECQQRASSGHDDTRSRVTVMMDDISILYRHMILPAEWRSGLPPTDQQWSHFRAQDDGVRSVGTARDADTHVMDSDSEAAAVKERFHEALGQDQSARFEEFIDGIRSRVQPSLHYLHVMLPHRPFRYMPSGRVYESRPDLGRDPDRKDYWGPNQYLVTQMQQRHLLQVRHVDALVGKLLDVLERERLLDASLLVVTADHGIGFQPGLPWRKLIRENAGSIVNVPLFIKLPGQDQNAVDDRNVELTDVLPTIADALSIELDWEFDGRSLLESGPIRGDTKRVEYHGEDFVLPGDLVGEVLDVVERRVGRFGPSGGDFDLFRIGPHGALVGQSLDDLTVDGRSDLTAQLTGREKFVDLEPDAEVWPNRLIGQVSRMGSDDAPVHLAVTVNGMVAAVGQTHGDHDGSGSLSIMTPDDLFVAGSNDVRLFEIRGSSGRGTLHEIELAHGEER